MSGPLSFTALKSSENYLVNGSAGGCRVTTSAFISGAWPRQPALSAAARSLSLGSSEIPSYQLREVQ